MANKNTYQEYSNNSKQNKEYISETETDKRRAKLQDEYDSKAHILPLSKDEEAEYGDLSERDNNEHTEVHYQSENQEPLENEEKDHLDYYRTHREIKSKKDEEYQDAEKRHKKTQALEKHDNSNRRRVTRRGELYY